MIPQLFVGAILTGIIWGVCRYFRPPTGDTTPVSEECRQHWRRMAMLGGDDPNTPNSDR